MELREGYKQTEVGVIPDDWLVKRIAELSEVIRGASPRPKGDKRYYGGKVPRLMVQDVTRDGMYVTPQIDFLTEAGAKLSRPCKKGTLILVCSGTVGVPSILAVDACIHDGFLALINLGKNIKRDYLYQFFITQQEQFDNSATHGGVFTNLTTDGVRDFLVPVPTSVEEQTTIANALSDADALILSLTRLIAKKRQIKQGAMQTLLNPCENGRLKEGWVVKKLGEVTDILTGFPFPSSGYVKEGIRLLRGSNIKRGETDWSDHIRQYWPETTSDLKKYELREGDIVVAMDGSLVGKSFAQLQKQDLPSLLLQRVARIRVKSKYFDINYIKEWVCSEIFTVHCDSLKTVTAIPHISPADIFNFVLNIPEEKSEQIHVATTLSDMEKEITVLETKLTKTQQIKQGMMQNLLTGKIRLVTPKAKVVPITTKSPELTKHNEHFNEAVVIAVLADKFGSHEYPLGRKRYTKLSYLLHRYSQESILTYEKKAAGPYNSKTRYGGAEKIAISSQYISAHKNGNFTGFVASENIAKAYDYFNSWYGHGASSWLEQFRKINNDILELWTTVDMAIVELNTNNTPINLESVKNIIASNKEWKPKLARPVFSDDNIAKAINKSQTLFSF